MIIICLYLIFIFNLQIFLTIAKRNITVEYNGLLWVALDRITILVYDSDDKPMNWIEMRIVKNNQSTR